MFLARLPLRLAELERALAAGTEPELRWLAHSMKGSAGAFGFPGLGRLGALLEAAEPADLHSRCRELVEAIRGVLSTSTERFPVLFVGRDEERCVAFLDRLAGDNRTVVLAHDAEAAAAHLGTDRFLAVLVDLWAGGGDGRDLLARLRRHGPRAGCEHALLVPRGWSAGPARLDRPWSELEDDDGLLEAVIDRLQAAAVAPRTAARSAGPVSRRELGRVFADRWCRHLVDGEPFSLGALRLAEERPDDEAVLAAALDIEQTLERPTTVARSPTTGQIVFVAPIPARELAARLRPPAGALAAALETPWTLDEGIGLADQLAQSGRTGVLLATRRPSGPIALLIHDERIALAIGSSLEHLGFETRAASPRSTPPAGCVGIVAEVELMGNSQTAARGELPWIAVVPAGRSDLLLAARRAGAVDWVVADTAGDATARRCAGRFAPLEVTS